MIIIAFRTAEMVVILRERTMLYVNFLQRPSKF